MSNAMLNRVWAVRGIGGTEKLVLVRLADRANDRGSCFPGQTSIAADCGLTTRTVRDALAALVKKGHLRVIVPATFITPATYQITPVAGSSPPENASGGTRDFAEENGSDPSGTSFRSPPDNGSGPLRKELPTNPNVTPTEPSVPPNGAEGREEANPEIEGQANNLDSEPELGGGIEKPTRLPKPEPASKLRKSDEASPWVVACGLEIPETLRTPECLEAVQTWLRYKNERREGYKETGLRAALTKWANEFTADEFPSAVQHSMASSWKGIFRPEIKPARNGKPSATPDEEFLQTLE